MRWRDIIIGAMASLLVTVLGGVAVYYFTKEPEEKKAEALSYSLNQNAQFTGGSKDLTFSSIELSNSGNLPANDVTVIIKLNYAEIQDLAVNASAGLRETSRERTPKSLRISYATLLPKEQATINLILTQPEGIKVDVRSNATLGKEISRTISTDESGPSKANSFAKYIVPISGALAVLMSFFSFRQFRGRFANMIPHSRNNAGFLLLHTGNATEAEVILKTAVREGECDKLTLSNYALCKAAQGHFEDAEMLMAAATFRKSVGHEKAVILFNQALIKLLSGDRDTAVALLKESLSLSKKEILNYCDRSAILTPFRLEPALLELLNDRDRTIYRRT